MSRRLLLRGALLPCTISCVAGLTAAGPLGLASGNAALEFRHERLARKEASLFQKEVEIDHRKGPGTGKDVRGFPLLVALGFKPRRILDVGANVGDWTRQFLKLFPDASFLMLDGTDHTRRWQDLLHTGTPGQVEGDVAILGDRDGTVDWYEDRTVDTGNSIHREQSALFNQTKALLRPIQRLDTLLKRTKQDPRFDLMKLDVQGSELDVLRGAGAVLSHAQVLLLEMPFVGTFNEGSPSFAQYIDFLDAEGFTPFDIEQFHRVTSDGGIMTSDANQDHGFLIQVDLIFVRKGSSFLNEAQKSIGLVGRDVILKEAMKHPYSKLVRDFYTIH